MTFVNLQIDTDGLPKVVDLEMQPMSPAYIREVLTQQLIISAIVLAASFVPYVVGLGPAAIQNKLLVLPVVTLLVLLLLMPFRLRQARVKAFAIREHDIAYCSGLIFRRTVLLAFNRVQHIEVAIGPLQKKFGLASLKFFTAGGVSVDLKIDGLQRERAEQLREFILARSGHRGES